MSRTAKQIVIAVTLFPLVGCAPLADRLINRTRLPPSYTVDPEAERLHQTLFVVDLHHWLMSLLHYYQGNSQPHTEY